MGGLMEGLKGGSGVTTGTMWVQTSTADPPRDAPVGGICGTTEACFVWISFPTFDLRILQSKTGESNRQPFRGRQSLVWERVCCVCFLSFSEAETNNPILCCLPELSRLTRVNSAGGR